MNAEDTGSRELKGFVQYGARYAIGIPSIDAQHKKLIDLCNNLHSSVVTLDRNGQREKLIATLKECVEYVTSHFRDEETLMQKSGYEGLAAHKERHKEFTRTVLETAKDIEGRSITNALKFATFLHDWILQHISYEDKCYAPVVKAYLDAKGRQ